MNTLDTTLDNWTIWMRAQGLSERTIGERCATVRHLLSYVGTEPLALSPDHIQMYLARRMSPASGA